MSWLENKYALLISGRLANHKIRRGHSNFRCPFCGDSKKSSRKSRGWLIKRSSGISFYCHNCFLSLPFKVFLKRLDPVLYSDYLLESLAESGNKTPEPTFESAKPKFKTYPKIDLPKISNLPVEHPAKVYVQSRLIPSNLHYQLFYTKKFKQWANTLVPDKFDAEDWDEPRLVIPFYDENKNFFGFQGRSFRSNAGSKYITIMLDESKQKLYGLDRLDKSRQTLVFEGPIDAMFIDNALACCGGKLEYDDKSAIIVYDNEKRSPSTVKKMTKAIQEGYRVCIWPDNILETDINDMILAGYDPMELKDLIIENSYSGLEASLRLTEWKKI